MTETPSTDARTLEPAPIAVDSVSVSFGDISVLEDVSVTVDPGEFVGLVGPNGAGKTTLLRTISGTLEPDSGSVSVDGVDLQAVSSKASSRLVAVVPQDTTLSFSFPVADVVEMGRHPHRSRFSPPSRDDREIVEQALERTRTADFADRPIDEVSGGQRQRVVMARAIAQETPALLLDEPTASLDINHAIETLELVRELVADGRTAVAAIHDLDLAARYCDRLVMLADGGVRAVGPPSAVLTREALADAFDANATVVPNPVTGTETVTALPNAVDSAVDSHEAADRNGDRAETVRLEHDGGRETHAHVVGTGTTAAGTLARLAAADLSISAGPVTHGVVTETAARLEAETITVDPHTPLSDSQRRALEDAVGDADVTILADPVVSSGNECVLAALESASPLVVTDRQPLEGRLFAGETARARYDRLRRRALETSPETVLEAVQCVLDGDESGSDRDEAGVTPGLAESESESVRTSPNSPLSTD
ncbi:ABC transporter ATP-binding protein [Natronobacterium gregoryi]|uniref:Cobalamin import ATP-binding protein BtuD n=2 Tax=Natronobacterium gregoryi TaxID=44930 RepID=L0AM02_NATGS|nr:ATP-binding cassette domain-containing protein [Natronobacterium gregoryi]AFZ74923.1 ABC-type cobalamin/Fe3+-siderophore transport system, ATPase component [Natronobacterium gregoryi SP2]ELY67356.1 ABC transporter [Natronobacterium gregoryi SP2]PLK19851.1 ABC transporter [Natronobacterium gregoryi SP2]SFJ39177.1 iron complex transport system ATP-binding protein [Natronobacterium gregoryi]